MSSFWIHGSPGQGKSVLAKFLTKHLEDHSKSLQAEEVATISFFCYNQEEYFRQPTDILRALILQLVNCQELFEYLPHYYQASPSQFFAAPLSNLWELFSKLALDSRYCVIDALDECIQDGDQRADLLRRLIDLFSSHQGRMKLLVTSRPGETDIEHRLHPVLNRSLHAQTEDLNLYVESKTKLLPSYSFSDQLKTRIRDTVCAQAGGTFLWAYIVMKQILEMEAPSLHEVERLLEENPKELNELYVRLVTRLITTPVFAKVLTWVAYAER